MIINNKIQSYLKILDEMYGLIIFIFIKFSQNSTYPFVTLQDFVLVLKTLNFEVNIKKAKIILQNFYELKKFEKSFYFKSEIDLIMIFLTLHEPDQLIKFLKNVVKAKVAEFIWDRNYNKEIWNKENMQIMNLIFSNIQLI